MAYDISYGLTETQAVSLAEARLEKPAFNPLGCGVVRPFRRTARGDFANDCGEVLVRSDLGQLLGTVLGEVPWRTSLGTQIYQLRHRANSQALGELARVQLEEAIKRYEKRVQLLDVSADPITVGNENRIQLRIRYRIGGTKEREDTAVI